MIYSVNYVDLAEKINPFVVCQYVEQTGWQKFPFKRSDVKVYQNRIEDRLLQIIVPIERTLLDYKVSMYEAIKEIAKAESKSIEQVMLYLLNPNTDIIKIRLEKSEVEPGNILFDDAIRLFDNAKKLIAATALDIINPKKIHSGRIDEPVQVFLNQCKFGQTEIGSYVVSVVCPFAELSEQQKYLPLGIFSDEQRCADSLTRKVTKRLIDNIAYIKDQIDTGRVDSLTNPENQISSNFFEALNGLNLDSENVVVDFTPEWSPLVKINRSSHSTVRLTNDYYQPISTIVQKLKEETEKQTEIVGRISKLAALPSVDKRKEGEAVITFINEDNRVKNVKVTLSKEDYQQAVEAHKYGKVVKVIGSLTGGSKLKMENAIFSLID